MKLIFVLSVVFVIKSCSGLSPTRLDKLPSVGSLVAIGVVGNKVYYTDEKIGVVSWSRSLEMCHENGMSPITFASALEQKVIEAYAESLYNFEHFWLGATDMLDEGNWYWVATGSPVSYRNLTFVNWARNEPIQSRLQNCAFVDFRKMVSDYGQWKSNICSDGHHRPLCEVNLMRLSQLAKEINGDYKFRASRPPTPDV